MKNKFGLIIVLSITLLFASFVMSSCGKGKSTKWDTEIEFGSVCNDSVQFGSEYELPEIYALDTNGNHQSVNIKVVNPKGKEIDAYFGVVTVNVVGEWTVTLSKDGLDDFVYKFNCIDTEKPKITITEAPSDIEMGNTYNVVVFGYEDNQGIYPKDISYELVYSDGKGTEEKVEYDEFTGTFNVTKYGWYIFRTTATDRSGNSSSLEKKMYVKNYSWTDDSLEGNVYASYDCEEYINTVSKTEIIYWDSVNDESYLENWHGESGVLKIRMNYNNTLAGQVTSRIMLPIAGGVNINDLNCIKVKYRIEQGIDTVQLLVANPNTTRDSFNGVLNGIKCGIADENDDVGYWQELIFDGSLLRDLSDGNMFKGFIIGMSRGTVNPSLYADLYIASIANATRLATPKGLEVDDGILTWSEVEHATGYILEADGVEHILSDNYYKLSKDVKSIRVKAISDNELYADSNYTTTEKLPAPVNVKIVGSSVTWDEVEYSNGYVIYVNGKEFNTVDNSYELTDDKNVVKVKAISGHVLYVDSDYSTIVTSGIEVGSNYLSDFNMEESRYLIENSCVLYYDCKNISTEYLETFNGRNGVVKINEEFNDAGIATFRFTSALPLPANSGRLLIRMYIEGNVNNSVYLFGYNHTGVPEQITVEWFNGKIVTGKWFILSLDANKYVTGSGGLIEGLQLTLFRKQGSTDTNLSVYLDEIAIATTYLDTPSNTAISNNVLTWDSVSNATGYVVKVNDEEFTVTDCRFDLPTDKPYVASVKAISDDIFFIDSEYSNVLIGGIKVPEGYLADFSSKVYEGFVDIVKCTYDCEIKSQTYLTSYNGESNVLCAEIQSGADWNAVWGQYSTYSLKLPNKHGTNGYTVKFTIENASGATFGFCDEKGAFYETFNNLTDNEWKTVYVKDLTENNVIYFGWDKACTDFTEENIHGTTFKVYFSFVKDGNAVD